MSETVLILGAAGRLGRELCLAFSGAGWRTLAHSRKPLPAELLALPGLQAVSADALDVNTLLGEVRAAGGAGVVINALNPPYTQWHRLALPLASAAQDLALGLDALLVLPGNVYNFGSTLPPLLRRNSAEHGDHDKARIRIAIEAQMAAADKQGLDSVVLRAGDFFGGAGRGSWFDLAIASRLAKGEMVYPGSLDRIHAWAYLPDLAQAFVRVASQRERLYGHSRLHFAGHAVEGQVLLDCLNALCARPLRAASLPWGLIRLGAPLVPSWRAIVEMRYLWERPHQLDDSDLRQLIGPPPRTALATALRQSLQQLGLGELLRDGPAMLQAA
ncbi:epimerase [Paucibacter sp. APW11]|uniref:Epimerase n=1 Tax=Roseateles aquae TaxID=3077235 RepID=A0ABU3PI18_9BURK|nr:NAD-dependent epimerase/dehydratase family protein [Paucibacter sp. APW11]MDT9002198.1 epimerase [Paucibacter sp. APW11]